VFGRKEAVIETREYTTSTCIDGESQWFKGHFPGNPILPGVAQLKIVIDLVRQKIDNELCVASLSRVKFRKLIRPDEKLDIQVICSTNDNKYSFKITSGDMEACSGKISFTHNNPTTHT
jgi:3-hydroxyacyl-[acyl-carrier-protein] dehydratase